MTDTIKVLKKNTCKFISGKSTIGYQIGGKPDGSIYLRITSSSGGGFFSNEWISLSDVQAILGEHPDDKPITSIVLYPLFRGKLVNTPSFLPAALVDIDLLQPIKGKQRCHQLGDISGFMEKIAKMMSPKAPAKTTRKKASVKKKAPVRKKAASKRKSA